MSLMSLLRSEGTSGAFHHVSLWTNKADFMIFASAPEPDAAMSSLARRPKLFNALDNI